MLDTNIKPITLLLAYTFHYNEIFAVFVAFSLKIL